MENNKKLSLDEILAESLGADFDAEKMKALKSNLNAFIGQNTVPKATFNDKNSKYKELKEKLAARADKQKDASEWKKQLDDQKNSYETQLKAKDDAFNEYRLTQALKDSKAKNPKAVKALLDLTKLTFNDDSIEGLEEQLATIKQDNDYMFDIPAGTVKGGTDFPANPAQPTGGTKPSVNKVI